MLSYPKILQEIGWNDRRLDFNDFLQLCERFQVRVFYHDGESEGLHFIRKGKPVIVLNRFLSGHYLEYVAFHELAHHLLGHDGLRYFVPGSLEKAERQANVFAICAILPEKFLYDIAFCSAEIWDYPKDLVKKRMKVFEQCHI